MASRALIAWDNLVRSGTLYGYSQAFAFPLSNLDNELGAPSLAWQTEAGVVLAADGAKFSINSSGALWRMVGLFRTNLTASATVTFTLRTGTDPGSVTTITSIAGVGPIARYRSVIGIFPSAIAADSCLVSINDSGNPDSAINIPLAFAGNAWNFLSPPTWATEWGRDDRRDGLISLGGQEWITPRWSRRRCDLRLTGVRASETFSQLDILDFDARDGRNVLFVPDYSSANLAREAIFGMLTNATPIGYPYAAADRRSWAAVISERL